MGAEVWLQARRSAALERFRPELRRSFLENARFLPDSAPPPEKSGPPEALGLGEMAPSAILQLFWRKKVMAGAKTAYTL